jgi:hypothetical protein
MESADEAAVMAESRFRNDVKVQAWRPNGSWRMEARDTDIKLSREILEDSLAERIADELSFCWRMRPLRPKSRGFLPVDRVHPVQNLRRRLAYRCSANVAPRIDRAIAKRGGEQIHADPAGRNDG